MIIGIVCCDNKFGIGKKNDLLFHLPKDMAFFRNTTADAIVVCGMQTLLSFPGSKPLKGRSTICLCPPEYERDDCFCIHDFDVLVRLVKELSKTKNIYIIGGAQTYASFLPYYDEVLVTKVDADGEAEVFFPNLDESPDFEGKPVGESAQDGDYTIQFWTYKRNKDIN
jgi:dihydrofolate reductase